MAKLPDDETLMAYVDGALSDAEMARIAALLDGNPELQARLLPFEVTRERLPDLISAALSAPMPDRLVHTVMTAPIGRANVAAVAAPKPALLRRLASALLPEMPAFAGGLALAACVTLIAGGGFIAARLVPGGTGQLAGAGGEEALAAGPLQEALETVASGSVLERGLMQMTPVLTVRDAQGRFCRQYAVQRAGADAVSGFACRDGDGRWSIAFHAPDTTGGVSAPDANTSEYQPASGEGGSALDRFIDKASSGSALTGDAEADLISKGWPRN